MITFIHKTTAQIYTTLLLDLARCDQNFKSFVKIELFIIRLDLDSSFFKSVLWLMFKLIEG